MWEEGEVYTREAEEGFSIGEHQLAESHRICAALGLSPLLVRPRVCVASLVNGPDGEPIACVDISADAGAEAGLFLPMVSLLSKAMEGLLLEGHLSPIKETS